jgi:hypothetical protein
MSIRIPRAALTATLILFALACQSGGSPTPAPAPQAAGGSNAVKPVSNAVKLGAPMTAGEVVPLARLAREANTYAKRQVKTEGKVTAVCQAMGCWMEIADADAQVHIRMTGHTFFVPKTASGRRAIVEGTLLAKPGDGECEKEAEEATGRTVKLELDATGVELL